MPLMVFLWYQFVYLPKQAEQQPAVQQSSNGSSSSATGGRGVGGGGRRPRSGIGTHANRRSSTGTGSTGTGNTGTGSTGTGNTGTGNTGTGSSVTGNIGSRVRGGGNSHPNRFSSTQVPQLTVVGSVVDASSQGPLDETQVEEQLSNLRIPRQVFAVNAHDLIIHDMPIERMAAVLMRCSELGFRPVQGTIYSVGPAALVTCGLRREPGDWVVEVGLNQSQLSLAHQKRQSSGLGIADMSSTGYPAKFFAIWLSGRPQSQLHFSKSIELVRQLDGQQGAWLTGCLQAERDGQSSIAYAWDSDYDDMIGIKFFQGTDLDTLQQLARQWDPLDFDARGRGRETEYFFVYLNAPPRSPVRLFLAAPSRIHGVRVTSGGVRGGQLLHLAGTDEAMPPQISSIWTAAPTIRPWIAAAANRVVPPPDDPQGGLAGHQNGGHQNAGQPGDDQPMPADVPPHPLAPFGELARAAGVADSESRQPIPDDADVEAALTEIKQLYGETIVVVKTPAERIDFAGELFAAAESEEKPAVRWALLSLAEDYTIGSDSVALWQRISESRVESFQVSAHQDQVDHYRRVLESSGVDANTMLSWAEQAYTSARALVAAERFIEAFEIAELSKSLARRANQKQLVFLADELLEDHEEIIAIIDAARRAVKDFEEDPEDAVANLALARYAAIVLGDWQLALPFMAKSSDQRLRDAAQQDLQEEETPGREAVADRWWTLGEAAKGLERRALQRRAYDVYNSVFDDLSGKVKARIRVNKVAELYGWPVRFAWLDDKPAGKISSFMTQSGVPANRWGLAESVGRIAIAGRSGTQDAVVVWDLQTGEKRQEVPLQSASDALSLSSDGKFVAVGSIREPGLYAMFDRATKQYPTPDSVTRLSLDASDNYLLWITREGSCGLLDLKRRVSRPLANVEFKDAGFVTLAPDGVRVALIDRNGTLQIRSLLSGRTLEQFTGARQYFTWLRDNSGFAYVNDDNELILMRDGFPKWTYSHRGAIRGVTASHDTSLLALSTSDALLIFDVATGSEVSRFDRPSQLNVAHFLADPRGLVSLSATGEVSIWRLPD